MIVFITTRGRQHYTTSSSTSTWPCSMHSLVLPDSASTMRSPHSSRHATATSPAQKAFRCHGGPGTKDSLDSGVESRECVFCDMIYGVVRREKYTKLLASVLCPGSCWLVAGCWLLVASWLLALLFLAAALAGPAAGSLFFKTATETTWTDLPD